MISVDGKPSQPIRVGAVIVGNFVLQSVAGRTAVLGTGNDGESLVTLEIPTLKAGARRPTAEMASAPLPGMGNAGESRTAPEILEMLNLKAGGLRTPPGVPPVPVPRVQVEDIPELEELEELKEYKRLNRLPP